MSETPAQTTYLVMPNKEALARVSGHIKTGKELLENPITNNTELTDVKARYRKWRAYGIQLLKNMFSDDSIAKPLQNDSGVVYTGPDFEGRYQQYRRDFLRDITTLESVEEMLPIMPRKPRGTQPKPQKRTTSPSVTQHFHGPVSNAIGINNGRAGQKSKRTGASDGKPWQLFLTLLGVVGAIAAAVIAAYIAYREHWV